MWEKAAQRHSQFVNGKAYCQKERAEREANGEEPTAKRRTAKSDLVCIRVGRRNEDLLVLGRDR